MENLQSKFIGKTDKKNTKINLDHVKKISYVGNKEFEVSSFHQSPKLYSKVTRPNSAIPNKNGLISNSFLLKENKIFENDKKIAKEKLNKYKRLLVTEFDQSKYIDVNLVHDRNEMDFYKMKNIEGIIKEIKRPQTVISVKKIFNKSEIKHLGISNEIDCIIKANKISSDPHEVKEEITCNKVNEKKVLFLDVNNNISKKIYERAASACLLPTHKKLGSYSKFMDFSNQEYLAKHKELIDFKSTEAKHVKKIKADSLESDIFFQKGNTVNIKKPVLAEKENVIIMDQYTHLKKGSENLNQVKKQFNPSFRSDNDWEERKNGTSLVNSYSTMYNPLNSLVKINTFCRTDKMNEPNVANRKKGIMEIHDLNRTFAPNWNKKFYEHHTKDKNLFNKSKNLCNEYYDLYGKYKNLADKPFKKKLI